jgi:asparagine synthase (glutamine-hydrolysing)
LDRILPSAQHLAGWFKPGCEKEDIVRRMVGTDTSSSTQINRIAQHSNWAVAASDAATVAIEGDVCLAILGEPEWRSERVSDSRREAIANEILVSIRTQGRRGLEGLGGEFLLVFVDADRVLAVSDRFARHPLYFSHIDGGLIFSSDLHALMRHPDIDPVIPAQSVYNYVYFHMVPGPTTIFQNVHKLEPASHLVFDGAACQLKTERYWLPTFPEATAADEAVSGDLLAALGDAVHDAAGDCVGVGSFLSGGLDSSTITGLLAQASGGKAPAFTIGFDEEGFDETPYARTAAAHFGAKLHEYYTNPADITDLVKLIARSYAQPFGNSSAVPAYCCARLAREFGITTLLAGDGGDELFAGNERYQKQLIFELYGYIPGAIRSGFVEPLVNMLPSRIALLRKMQSYVSQAKNPLPDRLQAGYNYVNRPELQSLFSPDFLQQVERSEPLRLQREVYSAPEGATALHRMLYLDWAFTLTDNDLVKVSRMCEVAGVDVRYPMLDDRVIDLACQIPASAKITRGELRRYFRQQVRDFLPEEILRKKKHGFGLPFGLWMNTHPQLRELVEESLASLGRRGIFDVSSLDMLLRLHQDSHATYFGELLWILMSLELWFIEAETRFRTRYSF